MPTKTEYREYIASEKWQERRRLYLKNIGYCENCLLLRWLAVVAYDQDLHVHHRSYVRVGDELDVDLQALCRRCHEIKTFSSSTLHEPQPYSCTHCGSLTFNAFDDVCEQCDTLTNLFERNEVIPKRDTEN